MRHSSRLAKGSDTCAIPSSALFRRAAVPSSAPLFSRAAVPSSAPLFRRAAVRVVPAFRRAVIQARCLLARPRRTMA